MRPTIYLVVSAVLLLALAALQHVCGGPTSFGHLVLPDGLLSENVPQLFQLIAGHFLNHNCTQTGFMWRNKEAKLLLWRNIL